MYIFANKSNIRFKLYDISIQKILVLRPIIVLVTVQRVCYCANTHTGGMTDFVTATVTKLIRRPSARQSQPCTGHCKFAAMGSKHAEADRAPDRLGTQDLMPADLLWTVVVMGLVSWIVLSAVYSGSAAQYLHSSKKPRNRDDLITPPRNDPSSPISRSIFYSPVHTGPSTALWT